MTDQLLRPATSIQRARDEDVALPLPSAVRVLIAPPLRRWQVWAGFHLPLIWRRFTGRPCDYLALQRRRWSYREYERRIGVPTREAYERLAISGAHVIVDAHRRDFEEAFSDAGVQALIVVGHDTREGVELADGIMPARELSAMLELSGARGHFHFAWIVCVAGAEDRAIVSEAPETFPLSAPLLMQLPGALRTITWWIEGLDGRTSFDVAQQRALVRSLVD